MIRTFTREMPHKKANSPLGLGEVSANGEVQIQEFLTKFYKFTA
jgi:hypothetical protein